MSSVKEIDPNYRVDWYRTPLSRELLDELNTRSDVKGFIQAGGYLLSIIATGVLLAYSLMHLHWGWWLPALILHGTCSSFTLNGIHELVHGTVFKTKKWNELFCWIYGVYGMWNYHAFWASHSEHHKYTLHDPEDSEVILPITHDLKGFLHRSTVEVNALKWFFGSHLTLARGIPIDEWGEHLYGEKELRFRIFRFSRIILAVHASCLLLALLMGWWWLPIVTTLHVCYFKGLNFLLNETQHIGLQDHVDDFRLNSRTFYCNPVFRFLYWNMNYHIEHHMYAGVPCYNLPKLHKAIQHELPYSFKNVAETWFHIITCLYRQKHEPGYVYIPVLPGGEQAEEQGRSFQREQSSKTSEQASRAGGPVYDSSGIPYSTWECTVCGFMYDEERGLPEEGIAPGTRWKDIPDDWRCPDCGVAKADFSMKEISRPENLDAVPTSVEVGQSDPIVFVGSGLAVFQTLREFRKLNTRKEIILITEEDGSQVYKPTLSNAFASGKSAEDLILYGPDRLSKELGVRILAQCSVRKVDRESKTLSLSSGEALRYSRLVLATGAAPRPAPFAGAYSVNSWADYTRFREALPEQGRVSILGAGLVGCEFANDLVDAGYSVTVVDPAEQPLSRLASEQEALNLKQALSERGVIWKLGIVAEAWEPERRTLTLNNGEELACDLVLSAIGLLPRTELAEAAGLHCGRGIHVDRFLRSSDEDIFALGDCAEIEGEWLPFIDPLLHAAAALAKTLNGSESELCLPELRVKVKTPAYPLEIPWSRRQPVKAQ